MAEYIEREAALSICQSEYEERLRMGDYCGDTVAWNIGGAIKLIPANDVEPVRHGRWVSKYRSGYQPQRGVVCDKCDRWNGRESDYCPNCGCKMQEAR